MNKQRRLTFNSPIVILVAIIFIGQQVYEGLFVQDNISNMGHIIGGLIGALAGYTLNKK